MKSNFIIILSLLALIVSCASEHQTKVTTRSDQLPETSDNEDFTDTIYSNKLVFEWSENILNSLDNLDGFSQKDTIVNNIHWPQDTDTIRTFRRGESKLGVYITKSKRILMDCEVFDPSISFSDSIRLGDSKDRVCHQLGIQTVRDTLTIIEEDGYGILFQFFFRKNTLDQIHYSSVID